MEESDIYNGNFWRASLLIDLMINTPIIFMVLQGDIMLIEETESSDSLSLFLWEIPVEKLKRKELPENK